MSTSIKLVDLKWRQTRAALEKVPQQPPIFLDVRFASHMGQIEKNRLGAKSDYFRPGFQSRGIDAKKHAMVRVTAAYATHVFLRLRVQTKHFFFALVTRSQK